ncbi:FAD-dependent oxidoreductase [Haloimpatiens massiliensis]|uniref:FAD-dependent oxidoreductase n=1 Tax=Haloimpatiens massiliensis TaxID=1658110 RepID=UPI000C85E9FD|nr:FAD-dependent oxidoreductase [Haloimpatiens massiliensis]
MKIKEHMKTDVLVVGAGIAGISSAIQVAKAGKSVTVVSSGKFCSGASFYPGTWGLGMVVAEDEKDKEDFVNAIMEVGCHIPNKKMVKILIDNAEKDIKEFMDLGIEFRRPISGETVIPCFDKKPRKWYGFDFKTAIRAFDKLKSLENVSIVENTSLIKILKDEEENFSSAIFIRDSEEYVQISAKALIIASGGFTNIYKYNLSTEDMALNAHTQALEVGCKLTNMEFIQFIPAHIEPNYKTIFNERVFNYIKLENSKGEDIFKENLDKNLNEQAILKERSTHGPFTCRLNSKYVDITMFRQYLESCQGVGFYYPKDMLNIKDTLIYNYFMWLKDKNALNENKIIILPFAHASNGGIEINEKAQTAIKGIYAAGEVTGGVHGADRIGGLSTVNAMVFGKIAGKEAIKYIEKKTINKKVYKDINEVFYFSNKKESTIEPDLVINEIREIMYKSASIIRNRKSLEDAVKTINNIKDKFNLYTYVSQNKHCKKAFIAHNYINTVIVVLKAMIDRNKSLGSHYRED